MDDPDRRVFQHAYYIGNYLSGILYGLELVLYFLIIRNLRRRKTVGSRVWRFSAIFGTLGFVLLTIDVSCNAVWGEIMWIEAAKNPGGVSTFLNTQVSVWYQTLGSASIIALIFTGDALLLHRLFIIWGSNFLIMIIPVLAYLAAFALAITQLVWAGTPHGNFFIGKSRNFGIPYYAITIGLNIIVTGLIWGRIVRLNRALFKLPEDDHPWRFHTNPYSIFIESAALYSLFGIIFLVPYAMQSQTSIAFGQMWAKLAGISPQLIILRMISGRAWSKEKIRQAESTLNVPSVLPPVDVEVALEEGRDDSSGKSNRLNQFIE
ncbi:hypothetical protein AN958_01565 [Leucoagaricus sp. SymC.cos]|nr:hypothetical protein AN958_01565 [Leucoagaricus sp. SymC.cos]